MEELKKDRHSRLKTTTNKDFRRFTFIPVAKFAAKIRRWG
jgi:hypothetical protein